MTETSPPVPALDDPATVELLDPQGALGRIESLPEQCEEAWRRLHDFELPPGHRDPREVVVVGMGGSAIAGDILRALADAEGARSVTVARSYELPSYVDADTLVIGCSHSGNTEEMRSAFAKAIEAGARAAVVTTGGRLAAIAKEQSLPAVLYDHEGEPRSALGHQLLALLVIAERAGVLGEQSTAVAEAVAILREQRDRLAFASPAEANPAKQIAGRLHGRLPVVVGAGVLSPAARRWRTQIGENSESWAIADELPELGHNTIVGLALPREVTSRMRAVVLWHASLASLVRHYEALEAELDEAGIQHERCVASGEGLLAQALSACHAGDFVSYYLALLNGVSPSPAAPIDRLKARLAQA